LRKTLIAAVAAFSVLAITAVAVAQNPAPVVNVTAKLNPSKAGTKKKPKSETLSLDISNSEESKSSAKRIEIDTPKTLKLDTKGLKTCAASVLASQGPSACPAKSKAGVGEAVANLNPDNPAKLYFAVTTFVTGKNKLAFFLQQTDKPKSQGGQVLDSGVQQALPSTIKKTSKGQRVTINIPPNLQQPAPGTYSALLSITNTLGLKDGKHALLTSVGCKSKQHKIGVTISYVPNPNPPAKSKVSATDGAPCSK
jgi:hypothetical protein